MVKRVFPSRYESLAEIGEFVTEQAEAAGLDEKGAYAVQLAVDEACSNIIEHAYGEGKVGQIKCTCTLIDGGLKIVLQDNGEPFAPDEVPEPSPGVPLEEYGPRGAGLFLMRKMMDEVKFDFRLGKGTTLTMVKRVKP